MAWSLLIPSRHKTNLTKSRCLFFTLPLLFVAGCMTGNDKSVTPTNDSKSASQITTSANSKAKTPEEWRAKMQALSGTLSSLLPLVASEPKFTDPKNAAKIDADVNTLRGLAHGLKKDAIAPNADPSLRMTAELFEEDLARASSALASGHRAYARGILRDTTSYCIQCHTQTDNGPKFPKVALSVPLEGLSPLERGEYYASIRQFDPAVKEFTKIIEDKNLAKQDSQMWEKAARAAVAITVKVDKNPDALLTLTQKILANPSTPQFLQTTLKPWLESAKDWKREKKVLLRSSPEQIRQAERLIERAQKAQAYPLDHSQDILYFRASAILHDLLGFRPVHDQMTAKALYLSGISAEATRDMNFWTLHERYYERCIQDAPGTDIARTCFARLEDSVTVGYTGSGGTMIPSDVSERLNSFRRLTLKPALPGAQATPAPAPSR